MAKGKKNSVQKLSWSGSVLTCEYTGVAEKIVFDIRDPRIKPEVREAAERNGWKQAAGDSKSGASPLEKFKMTRRRVDAWLNGSWKLEDREFSGIAVVEALAAIQGVSIAEIEALIVKNVGDGQDEREEFLREAGAEQLIRIKMNELENARLRKEAKNNPGSSISKLLGK